METMYNEHLCVCFQGKLPLSGLTANKCEDIEKYPNGFEISGHLTEDILKQSDGCMRVHRYLYDMCVCVVHAGACVSVCVVLCVCLCVHMLVVYLLLWKRKGEKGFVWEDKAWDAKTLKNKEEIVSYVLFLTLYHIECLIFFIIYFICSSE